MVVPSSCPACKAASAGLNHFALVRRALDWAVSAKLFARLRCHGNTRWSAPALVSLALLWVWSDQATLTGAFTQAREAAEQMFGGVALTTYPGLTAALRTWSKTLVPLVAVALRRRMRQVAGGSWRIGRWLALAIDGTRISVPRTTSNEKAFAAAHFGQGKTARSGRSRKHRDRRSKPLGEPVRPQLWLTLLWHVSLRLPWAWKSGPSTDHERGHFQELLATEKFPKNTLFCGDAGFVGYALWQAIHAAGHALVIRVGANVRLLRGLGRLRDGLVYCWPGHAERQGQPPLILRLVTLQGPRAPIYLVTNVLEEKELSDAQVCELYRQRWGVEVQIRALKQTFGRRTLRSRTAEHARIELDWSLLGLWLVQLLAVKEQVRLGQPPQRSSVALALRVVREMLRRGGEPAPATTLWRQRLAQAQVDAYPRRASKRARYRRKYKDRPSTKPPRLIPANARQRAAFQNLQRQAA